jgi:hypothetical protein
MMAAPKPKYVIKTIAEIQAHFPELPINDLWYNPNMLFLKNASFDSAEYFFNTGRISADYYEAFCAMWRNLVPRLSGTAIQYEF